MTPSIRLVAVIAALAAVMLGQTTGKTPAEGNYSIQAAMDEARDALRQYQRTLMSLRDFPEMDTTVREDSQLVLSGRNTLVWLRGKADLEGTIDTPEFEGLLDAIDACAADAALSSSVLRTDAARIRNRRRLQAAMNLLSDSEQLQNALNHLRQALKPYLQLEKPSRISYRDSPVRASEKKGSSGTVVCTNLSSCGRKRPA
jgi:hypothetical protein